MKDSGVKKYNEYKIEQNELLEPLFKMNLHTNNGKDISKMEEDDILNFDIFDISNSIYYFNEYLRETTSKEVKTSPRKYKIIRDYEKSCIFNPDNIVYGVPNFVDKTVSVQQNKNENISIPMSYLKEERTGLMVLDAKLTSCYKLLTSEIKNSIFLNISYTNKIGSIVIYNYRQIGPLQYFRDDKAKQLLLPYKALLHLLELRYDSIDVGDIMVPYEKKNIKTYRLSLLVKDLSTKKEFMDLTSVDKGTLENEFTQDKTTADIKDTNTDSEASNSKSGGTPPKKQIGRFTVSKRNL